MYMGKQDVELSGAPLLEEGRLRLLLRERCLQLRDARVLCCQVLPSPDNQPHHYQRPTSHTWPGPARRKEREVIELRATAPSTTVN